MASKMIHCLFLSKNNTIATTRKKFFMCSLSSSVVNRISSENANSFQLFENWWSRANSSRKRLYIFEKFLMCIYNITKYSLPSSLICNQLYVSFRSTVENNLAGARDLNSLAGMKLSETKLSSLKLSYCISCNFWWVQISVTTWCQHFSVTMNSVVGVALAL